MTGYLHPGYAQSLAEFGAPRELPRSKGWTLKRHIPESLYQDAIGCYPLFACQNWSQLYTDLEEIGNELISLSLVTDPFGTYDPVYLHQCFKDVVIPFKEHFIIDLSCPLDTFVSNHHRRYVRQSLRELDIEKCDEPIRFLADWIELYTTLIERHQIRGVPAFSELSFIKQLNVPGLVAFRAIYQATTVGMLLWYVQGEVGYYHLGAYSPAGYKLRASFALFWSAIDYFANHGLRWLGLGAGAGTNSHSTDGLSSFKRGWSTGTRTAYFCGRIFNPARYAEVVKAKGIPITNYFPAYRQGEFG